MVHACKQDKHHGFNVCLENQPEMMSESLNFKKIFLKGSMPQTPTTLVWKHTNIVCSAMKICNS